MGEIGKRKKGLGAVACVVCKVISSSGKDMCWQQVLAAGSLGACHHQVTVSCQFQIGFSISHASLIGTAEDLSSQMTKSRYHMMSQVIRITCKIM
jgi:hypothetical protein